MAQRPIDINMRLSNEEMGEKTFALQELNADEIQVISQIMAALYDKVPPFLRTNTVYDDFLPYDPNEIPLDQRFAFVHLYLAGRMVNSLNLVLASSITNVPELHQPLWDYMKDLLKEGYDVDPVQGEELTIIKLRRYIEDSIVPDEDIRERNVDILLNHITPSKQKLFASEAGFRQLYPTELTLLHRVSRHVTYSRPKDDGLVRVMVNREFNPRLKGMIW